MPTALIMCLNFDGVALYTKAYTLNFDVFLLFARVEYTNDSQLNRTLTIFLSQLNLIGIRLNMLYM